MARMVIFSPVEIAPVPHPLYIHRLLWHHTVLALTGSSGTVGEKVFFVKIPNVLKIIMGGAHVFKADR